MGMTDSESTQETLFWLSAVKNLDAITQARAELANNEGFSEEQIRAELDVHKLSI